MAGWTAVARSVAALDALTLQPDARGGPKPKVIVAAARLVPPALAQLWRELHAGLAEHHRSLEPKRLRPHITLARKVAQQPVLQRMSSFDWLVDMFSLVRSDTGGARSIHTVVDTWPLLDKRAKA